MRITVNGQEKVFNAQTLSLVELLALLGVDKKKIAVEHNGTIIPKSSYEQASLQEDDSLEIVHFIGGG